MNINTNIINFFDTDSYKVSHWKQLPPNATRAMAYGEARGGATEIKWFGLQYVLSQLNVPTVEEVAQVAEYCRMHFGRDDIFNSDGWLKIAEMGYFPLKIRAVREGGVYPTSVPLFTVENTHPDFVWLVTWFETQLLRVWYPTNVATISYEIKNVISDFLEKNGTPESIEFKLHDFGSRGATSAEAAGIGGMAHLLNFKGSDTLMGWMFAKEFYGATPESLGFSIAASEHSTITSWGRDFEVDAYENLIRQLGGEGNIYACVSDSYDLWAALEKWKQLEPVIKEVGGTLVVRPDSGDPVETPVNTVIRLMELFGYTVNEKGYKVLPDHIRVIQGDGLEGKTILRILSRLDAIEISSDNIAFGMGGALLQKHDRDTFKFAYKMCAVTVDGEEREVFKDPITDPGKRSKGGYLTTLVEDDHIGYGRAGQDDWTVCGDLMRTVFEDSELIEPLSFDAIR